MADYPRITGTIRPTPRNRVSGFLADLLELGAKGYDVGSTLQAGGPITEGKLSTPVSDLLGVPELQRTLNRISYNEPLTTGTGYTTRLRPDTLSAAMTVAPGIGPTVKAGAVGARMAGTALKDLATSDVAYRALNNALRRSGGLASAAPESEVSRIYQNTASPEALRIAQQRAALPVEKGGLGLPPDNTPMDRAKAMGAIDVYHGTDQENQILRSGAFDVSKDERNVGGIWTTTDKNYADWLASQKSGELPSVIKLKLLEAQGATEYDVLQEGIRVADEIGVDRPQNALEAQELLSGGYGWDSVISDVLHETKTPNLRISNFHDNWHSNPDYTTTAYVTKYPDLLRLTGAAFDPFRRNTTIATAMGVAAPDLLAKEKNEKKKKK